jgi:hypothetical protein
MRQKRKAGAVTPATTSANGEQPSAFSSLAHPTTESNERQPRSMRRIVGPMWEPTARIFERDHERGARIMTALSRLLCVWRKRERAERRERAEVQR